ncbi:MAG: hypothetical protein ACRCX2_28135 [Paraclostridium sp.]
MNKFQKVAVKIVNSDLEHRGLEYYKKNNLAKSKSSMIRRLVKFWKKSNMSIYDFIKYKNYNNIK